MHIILNKILEFQILSCEAGPAGQPVLYKRSHMCYALQYILFRAVGSRNSGRAYNE